MQGRSWICTALLIAALTGCATNGAMNNLHRYAAENKPKAEAGQMKWSEYYERLYNLAALANVPGDTLQRINESAHNAKQVEDGAMGKDEFNYRQRGIVASEVSADQRRAEVQQAQSAAQLAAAAVILQNSRPYTLPAPAVMPQVQAPIPMTPPGFLQTQSVSGQLRYCKYTNGVVTTIGLMSMCPLNTQ